MSLLDLPPISSADSTGPRAAWKRPFLTAEGRLWLAWRILLVLLAFLFAQGMGFLAWGLLSKQHVPGFIAGLAAAVIAPPAMTFLVLLIRRRLDRRDVEALGLPKRRGDLVKGMAGFVVGGMMMGVLFAVEVGLGWVRFTDSSGGGTLHALSTALGALFLFASVGYCEELTFRGAILRQLNEPLPLWAATLLCGAIFGSLHLLNGNPMGLGFIAASTLMTGFLVTTRQLTGSLAWAIGWHASWDLFQTISGLSGASPFAVVRLELRGPALWMGRPPAIEDGLLVILLVAAAFAVAWASGRDGRLNWRARADA